VLILSKEDSLLGAYNISNKDRIDPEKIEAIRGWTSSKNVTKVR
jgi:hypothetical protein